jgi:hypothetical protein
MIIPKKNRIIMKLKDAFLLASSIFSVGGWAALLWTFLIAYNSPTKAVRISINELGEANLELILIPAVLLFTIITVVIVVKNMLNREK